MINQFLNLHHASADQELVEDLIIECIQCTGVNVHYIPRAYISKDRIYGEDNCSLFNKAFEIEMYVKTATGFEGEDLVSKFGLQIVEQGKLTVSMKRFREITDLDRPYEGSLIYLPGGVGKGPLSDSLYTITFVQHEETFHQLGRLQTWTLDIDLFNYSNQRIRTGHIEIDKFEDMFANSIKFTMAAGSGRYRYGEMVYQGSSLATATARAAVIKFDAPKKLLFVKDIWGDFNPALHIIGQTSAANWTIANFDEKELPNSPIADNKQFEDDVTVKGVLDWSEKNPFGDE